MSAPKILAGTASQRLGGELAKILGTSLTGVEVKTFPDGELYVRVLEDLRGKDVVIVQTTYPNDKLVELLLLQEAAHSQGATRITTVVPYYAYSRQDRAFLDGEVISAKVLAEVVAMKADRVITVDPHKEHILAFFGVEAHGPSAVPEIAERLRDRGVDLVLAPDKGALDRAEAAAKILGVAFDHLEKKRISGDVVEMKPKTLSVRGKTVAIVDDIISTGGTIATAATQLKVQGADRVIAACTHGLFLSGAEQRMRNAGCDEVFATDSIEGGLSGVSAAAAVARALRIG